MKKTKILNKGFSLIELLIVLVAIPVIAIVTTQSLINVLSSQRKVDVEIRVRGDVEYMFSFIERRILNATDLTVTYPNLNQTVVEYANINGSNGRFTCNTSSLGLGNMMYEEVADDSGEVQLSDTDIDIYKCNIAELGGLNGAPKGIRMVVGARIAGFEGTEGGQLELTTIIYTRSY